MSSGNKPSWGSFLQQAVAGVEARLDNILAEDEDHKTQPSSARGQSPAVSRTTSTSSRTNDRLQQRLQRAVAAKAAAKTTPGASPRQSLDLPRPSSDPPRQSLECSTPPVDHQHRLSQDGDREEQNKERVKDGIEIEINVSDGNGNGDATTPNANTRNEGKPNDVVAKGEERHPPGDSNLQQKTTPEPSPPSTELPSIKISDGAGSFSAMPDEMATDLKHQPEKPRHETDKVVAALMAELDRLRSALQGKERQVSSLEARLQKALSNLETANKKASTSATNEKDRRRISDLEETVASLQVEKRLASDRAKVQVAELKEQADRATQRAQKVEMESKAELIAMESRLEAIRARAEEATTSSQADSEAKLLRQLQNLQAQHASASANWQGIETTLLSRISNLEGERDEVLRRESEMRKKARDAAARAKRLEEMLEEARSSTPNVDHVARQHKAQLERLTRRAETAEAALEEARAEIDKQKQAAREEKRERPDNERRTWLDDLPPTFKPGSGSRPASPQLPVPTRTFSSDHLGAPPLLAKTRKPSSPSSNGEPSSALSGQLPPRRPSALSYIQSMVSSAAAGSGGGGGQTASPVYGSAFGDVETPSAPPDEKDEMSDPIESITSPAHAVQEAASISTIAAGPSVQLVERMSAAIRRLESEKVAAREELVRISGQRDEARSEIVALMKEVEANKAATAKVIDLEGQVEDINQRYQTTLELLGEKSELVDELRADVEDVKQMYRDLVERTVR